MSIYPFNRSAFNRDLSFLQGGTYGLFQLLQRDNVTGKLGAVLIAADILHSTATDNQYLVGQTKAVQPQSSTLDGQRADMVAHSAFGSEITLQESGTLHHMLDDRKNDLQLPRIVRIVFVGLDEFLKFRKAVTLKYQSKKSGLFGLCHRSYLYVLHSIYDFNRCKNRKENTFRGILGRRNLLYMLNKINLAS